MYFVGVFLALYVALHSPFTDTIFGKYANGRINYPDRHNAWEVYEKKLYRISHLSKMKFKSKVLSFLTEDTKPNK